MARGKQLLSLIAQLRAETGRTQQVSVGVDEVENLKEVLRRVQETLYEDYDWPFLSVEKTLTLSAGQRYYDMPSGLNFDRITDIKYKYGTVFTGIERGIELDDYSVFDSNQDERSSPALKWDVRYTGSGEQIEVWPIPNATAYIYMRGIKELDALTAESDRAELDDRLIVLYAAAEILARQKSADAQLKMQKADARLITLRKNSQSESREIQIGLKNKRGDAASRSRTRVIVS